MQLAPTPKPLHCNFLRWSANNGMAPSRKYSVPNWFHLTTHTWVVWIKMTRWSLTTPSQRLERNGGAESSMILWIDPFTTALYLSKNLHTMQNGVRSCSGLTLPNSWLAIFLRKESVEGLLMSIYWLDMMKDISLTFSQPMRRGKH